MSALLGVEDLGVIEDVAARFLAVAVDLAANPLLLQVAGEGFGHRIVSVSPISELPVRQ